MEWFHLEIGTCMLQALWTSYKSILRSTQNGSGIYSFPIMRCWHYAGIHEISNRFCAVVVDAFVLDIWSIGDCRAILPRSVTTRNPSLAVPVDS